MWCGAHTCSSLAFCASSFSVPVSPVIDPIFDPATSQNLCLNLFFSFFSLVSFTSCEPWRAITARSDVGSFKGSTGPLCLLYIVFPLKKGGFVSRTSSKTRSLSSFSNSRLTFGNHMHALLPAIQTQDICTGKSQSMIWILFVFSHLGKLETSW